MSKLANLNIANHLAVFPVLQGDVKTEIISDIASLLGKEETNMISKAGDWKISERGVLSSKEGHKLQLPINNPAIILLKFGMQLSAMSKAGELNIEADLPKLCIAWFEQKSRAIAERKAKAKEAEVETEA